MLVWPYKHSAELQLYKNLLLLKQRSGADIQASALAAIEGMALNQVYIDDLTNRIRSLGKVLVKSSGPGDRSEMIYPIVGFEINPIDESEDVGIVVTTNPTFERRVMAGDVVVL